MAIRVRQPIKINPLDTTDKVAIGVRLPFGRKHPFVLEYSTIDHAKSKLINVLLTEPGERLNLPLFGVGLKQRLFNQQGEDLQEELQSTIKTQTGLYVPEITVKNIKFLEENHILYLTVIYQVIANSSEDSVTLSFTNTNFETSF